jgi:hypothetical protein
VATDRGLLKQEGRSWAAPIATVSVRYVGGVSGGIGAWTDYHLDLTRLTSLVVAKVQPAGREVAYMGLGSPETEASAQAKLLAGRMKDLFSGGACAIEWFRQRRYLLARDPHLSLGAWVFAESDGAISMVDQRLQACRGLDPEPPSWRSSGTWLSWKTPVISGGLTATTKDWLRQDGGRMIEGALYAQSLCALYSGKSEAGLVALEEDAWVPHPMPARLLGGVPEFISWAWDGRKTVFVGTRQHGVLAFDEKGWRKLTVEGLPVTGKDARPAYVAWDAKAGCLWVAAGTRLTMLTSP